MKKTNKDIIENLEDNLDYNSYLKLINETTERVKNKTAKDIQSMGDFFLSEMEERKKNEEEKKEEMIEYIINNNKKYELSYKELKTWLYKDVFILYEELKEKNKPLLEKIKDFLTYK